MLHRPGAGVLIAVIIIAVLVILVVAGATAVRRYEHYLTGLWVADPAFLHKARLRDLQVFIAPRAPPSGGRQGYLIITDTDGEFISNQAIEIQEHPQWWSALRAAYRVKVDAYSTPDLQIAYDDGDAPMPKSMRMTLSILEGTLTLYDSKKIYAFMRKDLTASATAIEAYNK